MNLTKLIGEIISMRQNDLLIAKHYFEQSEKTEVWDYKEVDFAFDLLQTSLTRLLIGHHYCTNPKCKCSAKNTIKRVIRKYEEIFKRELYQNQYEYLTKKLIGELEK